MGRFAVQPQRAKPVRGNLGYIGGKARIAPWVASLLPYDPKGVYIEPFCGVALVFFARRPVKIEILNDLNDRVVNYHRACRDHQAEFMHLLRHTPHARKEFEWARDHLDDQSLSCAKRALAFAIVVEWSLMHGDGDRQNAFLVSSVTPLSRELNTRAARRLPAMQLRLANATLECTDGVTLLNRVEHSPDAVVYVDPPYVTSDTSAYRHGAVDVLALTRALKEQKGRVAIVTSDTSAYRHGAVDVLALTRALKEQKGRVAISGYGAEWDHLGWRRHERQSHRTVGMADRKKTTEVLWTNYDPATGERL